MPATDPRVWRLPLCTAGEPCPPPASFIQNNGAAAKSQLHRIFVFAPWGENSTILIIYYFLSIIYNIVPQRAITRGQAVVLYDGDVVVGGGTIL